jgi:hypothetical protein
MKDVANEEINKRLDLLPKQHTVAYVYQTVDGPEFLNNITKAIERAGQSWTKEEDALLRQEFRTAVAQIALNHKRSRNAIRERLLHDGLYSEV